MTIATRTGDDGTTGLLGPGRVAKHAARIEAYGTVDELNAALGVARADGLDPTSDALLAAVQDDLFRVGAALADPDPSGPFSAAAAGAPVARLDEAVAALEAELPPLRQFILPGGTLAAAHLHLARTICRRAERRVVALAHEPGEAVDPSSLAFLNRLGDVLFLLARAANHRAGLPDVPWLA